MIEVLLVMGIFLTKDSQVEDLLFGALSCSKACLFVSSVLLRLRLQSVQYDLQHDFASVGDEAYRSVVLALLQLIALLGKCDDQGLGPRSWPFSCLSDLVADCLESSDYCFSICLDQFCWDVCADTWYIKYQSTVTFVTPRRRIHVRQKTSMALLG